MSYDYLLESETKAIADFRSELPMFTAALPELINTMFRLLYFVAHPSPPPDDGFHHFAFERYVNAPYTFRVVYLLAERGHFIESVIVYRHLLEVFVQIRYFQRHPDQLMSHLASATQSGRVRFKTMFEDLSPGYYNKYYGGKVLSNIAHGGLAISVFGEYEPPGDSGYATLEPRIGCKFDKRPSGFIINHVFALAYGFLNHFPTCFPSYRDKADEATERERVNAIAACDEYLRGQRSMFPKAEQWHTLTDPLIR